MSDTLQAPHASVDVVLLSAAAAALPGLSAALWDNPKAESRKFSAREDPTEPLDFEIRISDFHEAGEVTALDADGVAAGTHGLAVQIQRGEQKPGHIDFVRLPSLDIKPEGKSPKSASSRPLGG